MEGIEDVGGVEGTAVVRIVGTQVACAEGVKDTWREVAAWTEGQLKARYGDRVVVEYYDLFDPNCPPLPDDTRLPMVTVNGEVLSSGGKISVPAIRKRLEDSRLCSRPYQDVGSKQGNTENAGNTGNTEE